MMKLTAGLLLLVAGLVSPETRYFHYERPIENTPSHAIQACMAVDSGIFAHAAPGLADLRIYHDGRETPYMIHIASPVMAARGSIALLDKGMRGRHTVFDAEMPDGHYSDVRIDVAAHDFIATVDVWGRQSRTSSAETKIGSYTIFDLSKQRLGRSTVLHLPESDFRYLHFQIPGPLPPDSITGISVVQLPASQPRYVTISDTAQTKQKDHTSVFEFTVPAHVPVDRLAFVPGTKPALFSRDVQIQVQTVPAAGAGSAALTSATVTGSGNLLRVHGMRNGHRIDEEHLAIEAPQAEFDTATKWTVTIDNGDDAPLEMESVRLEMLERELCFDAAGSGRYVLYYGDAALTAPRYDYAKLVLPQPDAAQVAAGPEQNNPAFEPRPDERPFTERHPELLWLALISVILLLGAIAFRSLKRTPADSE